MEHRTQKIYAILQEELIVLRQKAMNRKMACCDQHKLKIAPGVYECRFCKTIWEEPDGEEKQGSDFNWLLLLFVMML